MAVQAPSYACARPRPRRRRGRVGARAPVGLAGGAFFRRERRRAARRSRYRPDRCARAARGAGARPRESRFDPHRKQHERIGVRQTLDDLGRVCRSHSPSPAAASSLKARCRLLAPAAWSRVASSSAEPPRSSRALAGRRCARRLRSRLRAPRRAGSAAIAAAMARSRSRRSAVGRSGVRVGVAIQACRHELLEHVAAVDPDQDRLLIEDRTPCRRRSRPTPMPCSRGAVRRRQQRLRHVDRAGPR